MSLQKILPPLESDKEIMDYAMELGEKIYKAVNPKKVYLFGSVVQGNRNRASDIDMALIISDSENKNETIKKAYHAIKGNQYPLDLLVFKESKFKESLDEGGIAQDVIDQGLQIFPKDKENKE